MADVIPTAQQLPDQPGSESVSTPPGPHNVDLVSDKRQTVAKAPESGIRFHDMDSLRAAMMLLGLVFHAAWFFQPIYFGNTLSDSQGSTGFLYFFAWVHQFRMHVFFLIAGFFACLLVQKRGHLNFAKNRFVRVVIPLLLSMLTIWPLMKFQYVRGGLVSGRILSDEPLTTQYWTVLTTVDWPNEWIVHLWFLECLILIYAIALGLRLAFDYVIDRGNRIRPILEKLTNRLTRSHWGPVLLAVPVALCMAYDLTWFGIDSGPLKPLWAGVFAYWIFFAVGWCLFAAPQIIDVFVRRWPAYLIIGSILSLALCGYFNNLLMSGRISWFYPAILDTEIDYPSLRTGLLEAAESPEESGVHGVIWDSLSPIYQDFVRSQDNPTSDQLTGFGMELTVATVLNPEFAALMDGGVPTESDTETLDPVANRELLAQLTNGAVAGRWPCPLWIRATYFYIYGLATWLMTFAMLGLFRQFVAHPSPSIRYLADSSYWLYLIHLPLQFELSIYLGLWEANGILKFVIYNVLTFAILLPTYHYLVRPTWIGYMLNGRLYPLRKNAVPALKTNEMVVT